MLLGSPAMLASGGMLTKANIQAVLHDTLPGCWQEDVVEKNESSLQEV